MLVLALDTTTRAGSLALTRDDALVEVFVGDASRTHATRLPGDLMDCLARHDLSFADVDLFAVAAGPGSFTGLRIGIATIQGLAFANARQVVGVSALDALAYSVWAPGRGPRGPAEAGPGEDGMPAALIGAWMDAQRHEVYAQLYEAPSNTSDAELTVLQDAEVGDPTAIVERWRSRIGPDKGADLLLVGDGALAYRSVAESCLPGVRFVDNVPPLAPAIALIGARRAGMGLAASPHAIKPVYVRRPDAELARDRRMQQGSPAHLKATEQHE